MSRYLRAARFVGLVSIFVASTLAGACAAPAAPAPTQAPAKPAEPPKAAPTSAPAAAPAAPAPTAAQAAPAQPAAAPAAPKPTVEVKPMKLTATAGSATSISYAYWVGVTKAVKKVYPQLDMTLWEASGSLDATKRVRGKEADLGASTTDMDWANLKGEENFQGQPNPNARILWYYDIWGYQWAVAKSSGVKKIEDLNGKKFNPGSAGSSMAVTTKKLFDIFGIKPDYFDAAQAAAADAMTNRQIIGVGKLGAVPDSLIQQIHASVPVEIVGLSKDQQAKALSQFLYFTPFSIAAKAYGDSQEALTVASMLGAQASPSMPQEVGYAIFKAMWEGGKQEWQTAHPQAANNNVPEMTLKSVIPLHAGSVQYLQEKGFKVPDNLIPPEYKR